MSWLSLSGSECDSSVKDDADNAFSSVTRLAASLGSRASPRADISDGSASGRRSTSMIKTTDDANVFGQISETTAVAAPNNNIGQQNETPSSPGSPGQWPTSNGNDNQSTVFSTDSTFGGGTHLTPSTRRARDLDLKNNDNSFSVIGGLICDFFAGRTTDDGTAIQLNPSDMEALDRLAPPRVRLGFVEAVRHRIVNYPEESMDALHTLTRQCRVLGLHKVGRNNPLLAPATSPIKLARGQRTFESVNMMSEPASVASSSTGSVSAMIARFGGKDHLAASIVSSGGMSSKSYMTPLSPQSAAISERTEIEPVVETVTAVSEQSSQAMQAKSGNTASGSTKQTSEKQETTGSVSGHNSERRTTIEPVVETVTGVSDQTSQASSKAMQAKSGNSASGKSQQNSKVQDASVSGQSQTRNELSNEEARTKSSETSSGVDVTNTTAVPSNLPAYGAPHPSLSQSGRSSRSSFSKKAVERLLARSVNGKSVGEASAGSITDGSIEKPIVVETFNGESVSTAHASTDESESRTEGHNTAGTATNASVTGNSGLGSSMRSSVTGLSARSSGIASSINTEGAPSAYSQGAQSTHTNGRSTQSKTATSSINSTGLVPSVNTRAGATVYSQGAQSTHTNGRSIQSKTATSSVNSTGMIPSLNTRAGATSGHSGLAPFIRTSGARTSQVAAILSTIEGNSRSSNDVTNDNSMSEHSRSKVTSSEEANNATPSEEANNVKCSEEANNMTSTEEANNAESTEEANKATPLVADTSFGGISSVSRSTKDVATGLIARASQRMQSLLTESKDSTKYGDMSVDKDMQDGENYEVAKNQLEAELREASNLMSDSNTPEAARFWRDQVVELENRLKRMKENHKKSEQLLEPVSDRDESEDALQANQRLLSAYTPPNLQSFQQESERGAIEPYSNPTPSHLDPSLQGVPMVDVVAPADLPGGYHFEAEIEGRRFLAIVPAGGVQKGETFSCYMRDLEKVASDIPVGHWRDGIFGCFNIGCCHVVVLNALLCPLLLLSQIMTRTNLDMLGRPVIKRAASPKTLKSLMFFWIFINLALLAAYNIKWSKDIQLSVADICALAFVNITYLSFVIYLTSATRGSLREKYFIRESRCFDYEDCCCAMFCLPCSLCQMARHTADYGENQAVCCNETGLPVTYNEGPRKDNQFMV